MRVEIGKTYIHLSGRLYTVTDIAREEDLGVDFVIHRGENGKSYARSMSNFTGTKLVDGKELVRFIPH